jgi:ethanolamine ammonia-lyase small subunit
MSELVRADQLRLRDYTPARVSLATAGNSLATGEVLDFQLTHARARDAVHAVWDVNEFAERLSSELAICGATGIGLLPLRSAAPDRAAYLRKPNLGRMLGPGSDTQLKQAGNDLSIVVADGLSALAVERNAIPVLSSLLPRVLDAGWKLAPIALVEQGRVGIGDPVGSLLGASMSLVLLGERPGLSAADSLGAYLTWKPGPGTTDADRNCISNIRDGGLAPENAADRLWWYLQNARAQQRTGTMLKEGSVALIAED